MTELKTLKDLRLDSLDGDYIYLNELRAEAIKRIKYWQEMKEIFSRCGNVEGYNCAKMIKEEYKYFFNITDEDLKKKEIHVTDVSLDRHAFPENKITKIEE